MAAIDYDSELRRAGAGATQGWRRVVFLARRHVLGAAGLIIMVAFVLTAVFADVLARFDPLTVDSAHALARPSALHWMGTDSFGRDVFSRIIHGARISLAVGIGSTILTEASLSFLGLGIPEPYPSWGRMLSESAAEYVRTAPWLVIFPGIAISLAVFGTNLFGDALRDILDPRQRG